MRKHIKIRWPSLFTHNGPIHIDDPEAPSYLEWFDDLESIGIHFCGFCAPEAAFGGSGGIPGIIAWSDEGNKSKVFGDMWLDAQGFYRAPESDRFR